jgi:hypothetical protein
MRSCDSFEHAITAISKHADGLRREIPAGTVTTGHLSPHLRFETTAHDAARQSVGQWV